MQRITKTVIALAITLLATQNIFAAEDQQQSKCPSVAALKTAGITMVEPDNNGYWKGSTLDKLGTKAMWVVVIGFIKADNDDVALQKANAALSALVFSGESHGSPWPVCKYEGVFEGEEIIGFAIPGGPDQQQQLYRARIIRK